MTLAESRPPHVVWVINDRQTLRAARCVNAVTVTAPAGSSVVVGLHRLVRGGGGTMNVGRLVVGSRNTRNR
jgi:hypothetical protein